MNSPEVHLPDERSLGEHSPGEHSPDERLLGGHFSGDRKIPLAHGTGVSGSLQSLLGTVVIAVFVITFVVQAFQIPSPSMENTLLVGDYLLVNKLCYGQGSVGDYFMPYRRVRRGDIVVFHYPVNPSQHFVKRVIGVPGDRVRLVNKQVFVNEVPLKEPYAHFSRPRTTRSATVFLGWMSRRQRLRSGGCNCESWSKPVSSLSPRGTIL